MRRVSTVKCLSRALRITRRDWYTEGLGSVGHRAWVALVEAAAGDSDVLDRARAAFDASYDGHRLDWLVFNVVTIDAVAAFFAAAIRELKMERKPREAAH